MELQKGFTLIELLIVVTIIGIIAAIAVPNLVESRNAAQEASAISGVRTICTAQITYASTLGNGNYGDLAALAAAGFVDEALGSGNKDGYSFSVTPNGDTGFTVTATPDSGQGRRGFYSDETAVIRWGDGSADENSPPLGANPALP